MCSPAYIQYTMYRELTSRSFHLVIFPLAITIKRRVLISLLLIFFLTGDHVFCEECTKISDCSFTCSGETFDISSFGDSSGQPKYKDLAPVVGEYLYSYNPCYPFTETDASAYPDECNSVASCQKIDSALVQYYDCGTQSSVGFQKLPGNEISALIDSTDLLMVASYTSGQNGRQTKVVLSCTGADSFSVIGEDPNKINIYVYLLGSPLLCPSIHPSGLSVGSILLIIFVVLVVVYVFGGVVFMRVGRGASGVEMFPNRELWTTLPGLIKDGVLFISRGCKAGSSDYAKY